MNTEPIFDLHTHFFGPEFFHVLAAAAHPRKDPGPGYGRLRAAGIEVPSGSPAHHARRWLEEMDRHGVERMATIASIPEETGSVREGVAADEGRLIPLCLVNPASLNAADDVRDLVNRMGMRGFVLFPAMHHYDLADEGLEPFFTAVEKAGAPLLVHLGALRVQVRDILGLPSEFDIEYAHPARLREPARRHPKVRFIIPHFGGGYFRETLEVGRELPNLAVDTSSSNSWMRLQPGELTLAQVFRRTLDALGPERIHFGTDSCVFPRGWRRDVFEAQTRALDEIGVSRADRSRILRENSLRLFGG